MLQMRTKLWAGMGIAIAASSPAAAEITAQVGGGVTYDDNLFRQSKSYSDLNGTARSDEIYSLNGQALAHVTPGDLDGTLQLDIGHNWYNRNPGLDNTNYSAQLGLTRTSLDGIGLNVTGLSERHLSSFADVRQRLRNIQELNQIDADTTFPITPEFRVVVDPSFTQSTSSSELVKFNDYRQYGVRAGLGWYSPLGNSIEITSTRRYTDGLHNRPVALTAGVIVDSRIDLSDTSVDIKLNYAISPFTSLEVFGSYVDRNDKSVLNSDYHGPSGYATLTYTPRETISFKLTGGRRLEAQSFLFVDSVKTDFVDFTATARVADRFDLTFVADHYRRHYRYDPTVSVGATSITDRNYRLDAELDYQFTDAIRVGVRGSREWRDSNYQFGSYHNTAVQLTASYAFRKGGSSRSQGRFSGMVL